MKEKYIEDVFPRYFIHGEYSVDDCIDVCSADVLSVPVDRESAEILIEDRDRIVDAVWAIMRAFEKADPAAATEVWYGNIVHNYSRV